MISTTITAFGYQHIFTDDHTSDELDIIRTLPIVTIISGDEFSIAQFELEQITLPDYSDRHLYWSDAGEALVFSTDALLSSEIDYLERDLDCAVQVEDRG